MPSSAISACGGGLRKSKRKRDAMSAIETHLISQLPSSPRRLLAVPLFPPTCMRSQAVRRATHRSPIDSLQIQGPAPCSLARLKSGAQVFAVSDGHARTIRRRNARCWLAFSALALHAALQARAVRTHLGTLTIRHPSRAPFVEGPHQPGRSRRSPSGINLGLGAAGSPFYSIPRSAIETTVSRPTMQ